MGRPVNVSSHVNPCDARPTWANSRCNDSNHQLTVICVVVWAVRFGSVRFGSVLCVFIIGSVRFGFIETDIHTVRFLSGSIETDTFPVRFAVRGSVPRVYCYITIESTYEFDRIVDEFRAWAIKPLPPCRHQEVSTKASPLDQKRETGGGEGTGGIRRLVASNCWGPGYMELLYIYIYIYIINIYKLDF